MDAEVLTGRNHSDPGYITSLPYTLYSFRDKNDGWDEWQMASPYPTLSAAKKAADLNAPLTGFQQIGVSTKDDK